MDGEYTITDLTQFFDVSARTLRYYEEFGLIQPRRRGLQRLYSDRDRVRIRLILRGRRLGFSLQEIEEMLNLYDVDHTEVQQLQDVLTRGAVRIAEVEAQMRDLTALHDELCELRDQLEHVLADKLQHPCHRAGTRAQA